MQREKRGRNCPQPRGFLGRRVASALLIPNSFVLSGQPVPEPHDLEHVSQGNPEIHRDGAQQQPLELLEAVSLFFFGGVVRFEVDTLTSLNTISCWVLSSKIHKSKVRNVRPRSQQG